MLTQIDVKYEGGTEYHSFPILGVSTKESLLIRKVTGLNPADVNLFIGDYARDGGYYQGRRVGSRNPVLIMDLNPNPALGETISKLREFLYKVFMAPGVDNDAVELVFHSDDRPNRYLYGYTDKFETEVFDVETLCQISLISPDPYLRDIEETVLTNMSGWITLPFAYGGTAETGFKTVVNILYPTPVLTLDLNAPSPSETAYDYNKGRMIVDYEFLVGDQVHYDTSRGSRDIYLVRDGVATSLIAYLRPESRWFELHKEDNRLKVYGTSESSIVATISEMTYRAAYWGV